MACKTTFVASSRRQAFTLVELLVASAVIVLIAGALVGFSLFMSRSFLSVRNQLELELQARSALDGITKELRAAPAVASCSSNSITVLNSKNALTTFLHDSGTRLLKRVEGQKATVLLKDCDRAAFTLYGRAPISGTYDLERVAHPALGKAVNVSWTCSRRFMDSRLQVFNSETATITLRMK